MKRLNLKIATLLIICMIGIGCCFTDVGMADDEHGGRGLLEREDQHSIPFFQTDNEGNETAGQITLWLLIAANLPVAMGVLIKWINRFAPLGEKLKSSLAGFNRSQKKHLKFLHYYLNPAILGVAFWHYVSSRCVATPLPEWRSKVLY